MPLFKLHLHQGNTGHIIYENAALQQAELYNEQSELIWTSPHYFCTTSILWDTVFYYPIRRRQQKL